jgi:NifU-like protein involved in Fe-S cluster formation
MMAVASYSAAVRRHCERLERAGSWPESDPRVGTGVVGSLDVGTMMRLQVRLAADGGRIEEARFKVFGCSAAIASASLAADRLSGATLAEAGALDSAALATALDLPEDKGAMAAQAVTAARAAIADACRKVGRTAAVPASGEQR